MGRPKKDNAIKSGDLQEGYQRFSFIAKSEQIEELRRVIKSNINSGNGPQTIKAYMEKKLPSPKIDSTKGRLKGAANKKNREKLKAFINKTEKPH